MKKYILFLLFTLFTVSNAQWEKCNTGLTSLNVISIAVSGNNIYAGTLDSGVYISTNYGNSWTQKNNGLTNLNINALACSGNYIYAGSYGRGLFCSTDTGNNWSSKFDESLLVFSIAAQDSNVIASTHLHLYLSSNNGNSWTAKDSSIGAPYPYTLAISGNIIYAENRGLEYSTDFGDSWSEFSALKDLTIYSIVRNGNSIYVGSNGKAFITPKYGGLYISTDAGVSWMYKYMDTPDSNGLVSTIAVYDNKIFIGNSGGVYFSTNNGNNWTVKIDSLKPPLVALLAVCGEYIFAVISGGLDGFGVGMYRAHLSDFAAVFEKNSIPDYFLLPNPTGSLARIKYNSPVNSDVSFSVTSLVGVKVKETPKILNQSAGEQICELDTSGLPSGAYFVTMMSGGTALTKQLIVIK